jgi:hypothetical protein
MIERIFDVLGRAASVDSRIFEQEIEPLVEAQQSARGLELVADGAGQRIDA